MNICVRNICEILFSITMLWCLSSWSVKQPSTFSFILKITHKPAMLFVKILLPFQHEIFTLMKNLTVQNRERIVNDTSFLVWIVLYQKKMIGRWHYYIIISTTEITLQVKHGLSSQASFHFKASNYCRMTHLHIS